MKSRIMYLENKSTGEAYIGRVTFSRTGRMVYYKGLRLQKSRHGGSSGNFHNADAPPWPAPLQEWWVSGPKKNGRDRHWAEGNAPVAVEPEIAEEYWTQIRGSKSAADRAARKGSAGPRINNGWNYLLAAIAMLWAIEAATAEPLRGYQPQVAVEAETRLDWTFALANQSLPNPPADWLPGYESTAQSYELFVPPNLNKRKPAPLVLFISPSDKPAGWSQWQSICTRSGVMFASPRGAGNDCPLRQRVRIILDVLDDIRRRQPIDADRTYLAGFSGGARIACSVAFALPEYFGGVVAICGSEKLRDESWLRQRVVDRLSVALVTGEQDFNRAELERLRGPLLIDVGVRAKVWTVPGLGHAIPDDRQLATVFAWLEEASPRRRGKAQQWPAMRITGNAAPSRAQWADALLAEARQRLAKKPTLFSGLMQLQGLSVRWPDTAAAKSAHELLLEYEAKTDRPWEQDDVAEQRRYLLAEARATDAYASGPLPPQYAKERGPATRSALELWKQVLADDPDGANGKAAAERIRALEQSAGK